MIACVGGAHIDYRGILRAPALIGTSNPGDVRTDFGGVARNVAHNLARLGSAVMLLSRVGDDEAGRRVVHHVSAAGIDTSRFTISPTRPTASYTAILEPDGELVIGLDDMDIYDELTPAVIAPTLQALRERSLWFIECNIPGATIDWLLEEANGIPVAVDAISIAKSRRLPPLLDRISFLFCNLAQAVEMTGLPEPTPPLADAARALQAAGAKAGVVSFGARGIAVWSQEDVQAVPALPAKPRDVTGAGDALISGTLYGLSQGRPLVEAACLGLAAAAITVESEFAAPPQLAPELLEVRWTRHV
jgi:pseudouridine kinase